MTILRGISCGIFAASSLAFAGQQPAATTPAVHINHPAVDPAQAPATTPPSAVPTSPDTTPLPGSQPVSSASLPPSAASPSTIAGVDNNRYIIGADDALQITVWREPGLSGLFPVRPDGMISLVLVGDLPASGLTPTALGADISQRLRKFVQDPSVTVQVMGVNSQKIFLVGEVGHVGPIALTANMSPLQAIATAGGPSAFAKTKHIYILRGSGPNAEKIPFNYKQALKGDNHQQIVLHSGDTIVVP